jgi:uncharacterized repeat protein (TIGR01451 family)
VALTAGSDGLVSFSISNSGQAAAQDVQAVLTLPVGITFTGSPGPTDLPWSCVAPDAATVVCTVSTLVGGGAGSLTVPVRVAEDVSAVGGDLTLSVVSGPTQASAVAYASIAPAPARIAVGQVAGTSLTAGTAGYLSVPVRNAGGLTATSVQVAFSLPVGVSWEGTEDGAWTCAGGSDPRDLVCSAGDVAPRTSVPLGLTLRADSSAPAQISTLSITASRDGDVDGVRSDVPFTVSAVPARLAVAPLARVAAVAGETRHVSFAVTNVGAGDASDVAARIAAPPGVLVQSRDCGPEAAACDVGALAAGASRTFVFDVVADGSVSGDLALTLTITGTGFDPLVVPVPMTVLAPSLAFGSDGAPHVAVTDGEARSLTFAVQNTGSADANNVRATVLLPAGVSVVPDGDGRCALVEGGVACSLGDLAPGATSTVVLALQVDAESASDLTVQVSVVGDRLDPISQSSS